MKRLTIFAMLAALALGFGSCSNRPSKQFKAMGENVLSIENQISAMKDCDELQMMNFAILGLRSDLDNLKQEGTISDAEVGKLSDLLDRLEATWNGKWASLDCEQITIEDELDTSGEAEDEEFEGNEAF